MLEIIVIIIFIILIYGYIYSLFNIPYRYMRIFNKAWDKEKLENSRRDFYQYLNGINKRYNYDNTKLSEITLVKFGKRISDLNSFEYQEMKKYFYERYDPKFREEQIDKIIQEEKEDN